MVRSSVGKAEERKRPARCTSLSQKMVSRISFAAMRTLCTKSARLSARAPLRSWRPPMFPSARAGTRRVCRSSHAATCARAQVSRPQERAVAARCQPHAAASRPHWRSRSRSPSRSRSRSQHSLFPVPCSLFPVLPLSSLGIRSPGARVGRNHELVRTSALPVNKNTKGEPWSGSPFAGR